MMKQKKLSIGLGTAAIGRPQYINIKQTSSSVFSLEAFKQQGIKVLDAAHEQGIRYFDTAPGYGMAEELLLGWVKEKNDSSIEVATKWGYTYVANFDPDATTHEVKEHSLAKLNEQWEQSKNLLPWLTTYQIHSATLETGVLENEIILKRLADLKRKEGLKIGLTTTGVNQVKVIKKALDINVDGESLFDVFQVTYNIFDQSLASISNLISSQNKRIVIKEALANGRVFRNENFPNYAKPYQIVENLASKYDVGVDAIALRFCIDSLDIYQVLSGVSLESHLSDNLKAANFRLEEEDLIKLKQLAVNPAEYWNERKKLGWN